MSLLSLERMKKELLVDSVVPAVLPPQSKASVETVNPLWEKTIAKCDV